MGRILSLLIVLPILYLVAVLAASEMGGEVVEIETQKDGGQSFITSVWVVDIDGSAWVRAGDIDSDWVARLRANPDVRLSRNGEQESYRAELRAESAERVNSEMRMKYGLADRIVTTMHDAEKVVAIRLVEH